MCLHSKNHDYLMFMYFFWDVYTEKRFFHFLFAVYILIDMKAFIVLLFTVCIEIKKKKPTFADLFIWSTADVKSICLLPLSISGPLLPNSYHTVWMEGGTSCWKLIVKTKVSLTSSFEIYYYFGLFSAVTEMNGALMRNSYAITHVLPFQLAMLLMECLLKINMLFFVLSNSGNMFSVLNNSSFSII